MPAKSRPKKPRKVAARPKPKPAEPRTRDMRPAPGGSYRTKGGAG
jgi:hypothetical protein